MKVDPDVVDVTTLTNGTGDICMPSYMDMSPFNTIENVSPMSRVEEHLVARSRDISQQAN